MVRFGRLAVLLTALLACALPATADAQKKKKKTDWQPTIVQVIEKQTGIAPGDFTTVDAECPGDFSVMGGSYVIGGASLLAHAAAASPIPAENLYRVTVSNPVTNPFATIPPRDASVTVVAQCTASGTPVVAQGRFKSPKAVDTDDLYYLKRYGNGLPSTVFDRTKQVGGIENGDVQKHDTNCNRGGSSVFGGGYLIDGSFWAHTASSAVLSKTNDYSATIVTPPSNPSLGVFRATAVLRVTVLCTRDGRPMVFNDGPIPASASAKPKKKKKKMRGTVKIVQSKRGGITSGSVVTVGAKCPSGYSVFGGSYIIGGNSVLTHPTAAAVGSKANKFSVTVVNPPVNINAGIPRTTAEVIAVANCTRSGTPIVVDGPFSQGR
jgi:hypothetical protein